MKLDGWERKRTVRLTTRGRKSGQPRTVTVWFVPSGASSIFVQHAGRRPAHWYANLRSDSEVHLDFGEGAVTARAKPIEDRVQIRTVLEMTRRKYWLAWVIQLLGRGVEPVAAEITLSA
jgi:deazaflavin-dependent oxidoreductase (nitroreductase family)